MFYENHETHHSKSDLVVSEVVDKFGQVHVQRGQGLRSASIYEQIWVKTQIRKAWLERPDGTVAYQPRGRQPSDIPALLRLRDWSYPHCSVVEWVGDDEDNGNYTFVSRPKSVTVTNSATVANSVTVTKSKSKCKRKSSKIRWP